MRLQHMTKAGTVEVWIALVVTLWASHCQTMPQQKRNGHTDYTYFQLNWWHGW